MKAPAGGIWPWSWNTFTKTVEGRSGFQLCSKSDQFLPVDLRVAKIEKFTIARVCAGAAAGVLDRAEGLFGPCRHLPRVGKQLVGIGAVIGSSSKDEQTHTASMLAAFPVAYAGEIRQDRVANN